MLLSLLFLLFATAALQVCGQQQLRGLAVNPQLAAKGNIKRTKHPTRAPTLEPTTAGPTAADTPLPTRKRLRAKVFKASPPEMTEEQYESAPSLAANNDQRSLQSGSPPKAAKSKSKSKSPTAKPTESTEGPTTLSPTKATKAPKGSKVPTAGGKGTPPPKASQGAKGKTATPTWASSNLGTIMRELLHSPGPTPASSGAKNLKGAVPDPSAFNPDRLPKKRPAGKGSASPSRGPKRSPRPVHEQQDQQYLRRHHAL